LTETDNGPMDLGKGRLDELMRQGLLAEAQAVLQMPIRHIEHAREDPQPYCKARERCPEPVRLGSSNPANVETEVINHQIGESDYGGRFDDGTLTADDRCAPAARMNDEAVADEKAGDPGDGLAERRESIAESILPCLPIQSGQCLGG